jgi:glycosyltransferase involved in cell wall biosynthesis
MLLNEIHPKLVGKYGRNGFRIKIFGYGKFPRYAQEIVEKNPEFETLGYVSDIRPILAQCHAMLAPIEVPVGNRTRIITAFSYGLPVIAHKNTSLGNPDLISGENCLLASTSDEIANYFFEVYDNKNLADRLAEKGKELYMQKNHPEAAARLFIDALFE